MRPHMLTTEQHMSDDNKGQTRNEAIDQLAKAVAEALTNQLGHLSVPEAFLIWADEMKLLFKVMRDLKRAKTVDDRLKQSVIDTIMHVFQESKPFDHDDLEVLVNAMTRAEQHNEWMMASSTDEWINCY